MGRMDDGKKNVITTSCFFFGVWLFATLFAISSGAFVMCFDFLRIDLLGKSCFFNNAFLSIPWGF